MTEEKSKKAINPEQDKKYIEDSNVTDWIQIGGFLIAAQLTIIALIWGRKPSTGIYSVTLSFMLSFAFLINSVFSNSKVNLLVKLVNREKDETLKKEYTEKIKRIEKFGYFTFNIAYSISLFGFTTLAYKYMIDFIGKEIIVLYLPIIFMIVIWILWIIYIASKSLNRSYIKELFNSLVRRFNFISILIELSCLILIIYDYIGIFIIP